MKFKIYPTPGFNQPVIWLAHDLVTDQRIDARRIERVTLQMNHLETLYPSPRFPRAVGKDGHPFGRTAFMLASTLVDGDYPVLQFYDPHAAPAAGDEARVALVAELVARTDIIGEVGRDIFSPRITCLMDDGQRITGEYDGRELMWGFAKGGQELRRFIPGLPIDAARYDRFVACLSALDDAACIDELVALTMPATSATR